MRENALFTFLAAAVMAEQELLTLAPMPRMEADAFFACLLMAEKSAPARTIRFLTTATLTLLSAEHGV